MLVEKQSTFPPLKLALGSITWYKSFYSPSCQNTRCKGILRSNCVQGFIPAGGAGQLTCLKTDPGRRHLKVFSLQVATDFLNKLWPLCIQVSSINHFPGSYPGKTVDCFVPIWNNYCMGISLKNKSAGDIHYLICFGPGKRITRAGCCGFNAWNAKRGNYNEHKQVRIA